MRSSLLLGCLPFLLAPIGAAQAGSFTTALPCLSDSSACDEIADTAQKIGGNGAKAMYSSTTGILVGISEDPDALKAMQAYVRQAAEAMNQAFHVVVDTPGKGRVAFDVRNNVEGGGSYTRGDETVRVAVTPRKLADGKVLVVFTTATSRPGGTALTSSNQITAALGKTYDVGGRHITVSKL